MCLNIIPSLLIRALCGRSRCVPCVQPALTNTNTHTCTHTILSTSQKHVLTQLISQLIHNQNWHCASTILPPPPFFFFLTLPSALTSQKYQAAEHQTLSVSPRPITVVLLHCYQSVMVGFSCLLLCLRQHKLLPGQASARAAEEMVWEGEGKGVHEEWGKSSHLRRGDVWKSFWPILCTASHPAMQCALRQMPQATGVIITIWLY